MKYLLLAFCILCPSIIAGTSSANAFEKQMMPVNVAAIGRLDEDRRDDQRQPTVEVDGVTGKRKYRYPSIMIKGDMISKTINGKEHRGLMGTFIMANWEVIADKYGRLCQYVSPVMTYAELQNMLNFNDEDVSVSKNPRPGEPHAYIKTEWLTCNITYMDKPYNGKDKSVKLGAVVIDNKVQEAADAHAAADKNKGVIDKILDYFRTSPH
jgi:hypothetical protein